MRTSIYGTLIALLLLGAVVLPARADTCATIRDLSGVCQGDTTIVVSWWVFATNQSCTNFVYSVERKCGSNGTWVDVKDNAPNPYYDPIPKTTSCAAGWIYRIKASCGCGFNYSGESSPVTCP